MPPKNTRGQTFRAAILEEFDCNPADTILLGEIAAVIDEMDGLPASAITERRLQRTLLSRLLSQLALPDEYGESNEPRSVKARKAAAARWGRNL